MQGMQSYFWNDLKNGIVLLLHIRKCYIVLKDKISNSTNNKVHQKHKGINLSDCVLFLVCCLMNRFAGYENIIAFSNILITRHFHSH